ncbi:MAG: sigma-70 family RNA polymerase sigma factor [Hyphomicrobiaceae bacterium]|nr:MAG: sigma-70 family RNA polymerase sigma factor [Hyphomicrobiaceae bacterium]
MKEQTARRQDGEAGGDRRRLFQARVLDLTDGLYRVALRLTRHESDAEELVAEAVAKAWAALDSLEDESRFRPWIFSVLINTFRSHCRRRGRELSLDDCQDDAGGEPDFSLFDKLHQPFLLWWSNPEQDFLNKLLGEDLQRAVDSLSECYRAVVVLVILEGCSYQEAADILAIPIGTVRSRVKRGRSLMQKALWMHAREAGIHTATSETEGEM